MVESRSYAGDTPEVKALVKVKHVGPEDLVRRVTVKRMLALADRLLDHCDRA
jgi:hypothetical protein